MSQSFLTGSLLCCCKQIIELPDDFYILIVRDIDTLNRIIHQFFQSFIIHGTCTLNDCLFLLCLIFLFKKIFIRNFCFCNQIFQFFHTLFTLRTESDELILGYASLTIVKVTLNLLGITTFQLACKYLQTLSEQSSFRSCILNFTHSFDRHNGNLSL